MPVDVVQHVVAEFVAHHGPDFPRRAADVGADAGGLFGGIELQHVLDRHAVGASQGCALASGVSVLNTGAMNTGAITMKNSRRNGVTSEARIHQRCGNAVMVR